jgi:hypothetical protein
VRRRDCLTRTVLALCAACLSPACAGGETIDRNEAGILADAYVVNTLGGGLIGMKRESVWERGNAWIVTYHLVHLSPGGTPTLAVNKRTGAVTVISVTQ